MYFKIKLCEYPDKIRIWAIVYKVENERTKWIYKLRILCDYLLLSRCRVDWRTMCWSKQNFLGKASNIVTNYSFIAFQHAVEKGFSMNGNISGRKFCEATTKLKKRINKLFYYFHDILIKYLMRRRLLWQQSYLCNRLEKPITF